MSATIHISAEASREERYAQLLPQVQALVDSSAGFTANAANMMAALKEAFGFHWVGVYLVQGDELILGPFQGPPACTRIPKGKGVCGTAWQRGSVLLVPDVEAFPGHIACSPLSRSELVMPFFRNGLVAGVLDIDSEQLNGLSETDSAGLSPFIRIIESCL
jgi:L-methionine (R)-S-oxide reductase